MDELPDEMKRLIMQLGETWAHHRLRPTVAPHVVVQAWDELLEDWASFDLPLVVRKGGGVRGSEVKHGTGRAVVIADNSPAQWAFANAIRGQTFQLRDIRHLLDLDEIPFAFAIKRNEKDQVRYKCTLKPRDKLLSPSNQILVPLSWGGLGELEEFIEGIRLAQLKDPANVSSQRKILLEYGHGQPEILQ